MNKKLNELFKEKQYKVYSINENSSLKEAVRILVENHIGSLMVLDDQGEIQGIFTERDVIIKLAHTDQKVSQLPVKEVMTSKDKLIIGHDDDKIDYLMQIMTTHKIRHLPIMKRDGSLMGILSIRDIIRVLLRDTKQKVKFLNDYISGKYPS